MSYTKTKFSDLTFVGKNKKLKSRITKAPQLQRMLKETQTKRKLRGKVLKSK